VSHDGLTPIKPYRRNSMAKAQAKALTKSQIVAAVAEATELSKK
jgi:hypothetical protein